MDTPLLKTTHVAFETAALTNVPQMAPSATVESTIACHALGMVHDPVIDLSMDSASRDFHPHPDISFSHFIFQFTLTLLFAVSIFFATTALTHPSVQIHVRYEDNMMTMCCLGRPSGHLADGTMYTMLTGQPDNIK